MRLAADDVGAGNAGLRLLSQLRFDIVKIDLSLVQGGAVREPSLEVVRTLRDLADRWGALVIAEGIETPAQLERRPLARHRAPARATCSGRPAEHAHDRARSTSMAWPWHVGDWLVERLRAVPGMTRTRPGLRATLTGRCPARLRAHAAGPRAGATLHGDHIGSFRSAGSPPGRRRHHDGRSARARAGRTGRPLDVSLLALLRSLPGLDGLLGLITGSRRENRGTRRNER